MRRRAMAIAVVTSVMFVGACTDGADPDPDETATLAEPTEGVPDTFPEDDIPLVDGEVSTQGDSGDESNHLIIVVADGEAEEVRAEAIRLMTAEGFEEENTTEVEATGPQTNLSSPDWVVLLTAQDDGGTTTLTYSVAPTP